MKMFLVKIGRKTRGGNFQELHSRAVSVSDDTTVNYVYDYFNPRYAGFNVHIESVPVEELSDVIPAPPQPLPPVRDRGCISFKIKYTEFEKQLYGEYKDLFKKTDDVVRKLHKSITERYKKLLYVADYDSIELETDDPRYNDGTFCKRLHLKSNDFFKAIKDCDDGTVELQITENTGNEYPDVPF
jgi:hypothetical protein